jgi:methyltransferase family protein
MAEQPAGDTAIPAHIRLIQLATAIWPSRVVYVAAKMGLADHLADAPKDARELAQLTGTHAPALQRVLIALTSIGILSEDADHRFAPTSLGAALRTGAPGSARAVILLMARDRLAGRDAVKASQSVSLERGGTNEADAVSAEPSPTSTIIGTFDVPVVIGTFDVPVVIESASRSGKVDDIAPATTVAVTEGSNEAAALLTRLVGSAGVHARRRFQEH